MRSKQVLFYEKKVKLCDFMPNVLKNKSSLSDWFNESRRDLGQRLGLAEHPPISPSLGILKSELALETSEKGNHLF